MFSTEFEGRPHPYSSSRSHQKGQQDVLPQDRRESLMARYRFWFHDRDKKGQLLDANILKAAEAIAPKLTRYRQNEIDGESAANDILQAAVEAASNATRRHGIENPDRYLAS